MRITTIKDWSKDRHICLTRSVAGELGQIATSIANELRIPLSVELAADGSKRNKYPDDLIFKAWNRYSEVNPYCKNISL